MNYKKLLLSALAILMILSGCSKKYIALTSDNLEVINRDLLSTDRATNAVDINNKMGDGLAIIDNVVLDKGTIELELKGQNTPGRSFVGFAFNIQNDSTYEAIYFRPFNFQAKEQIRREHAVQYIHHPKYTWRYLRTNHVGEYEATYPRQPAPEEWFSVQIIIEDDSVAVYDIDTKTKLLSVQRLTTPKSNKIGLWMGNNSKGEFRNLRVIK